MQTCKVMPSDIWTSLNVSCPVMLSQTDHVNRAVPGSLDKQCRGVLLDTILNNILITINILLGTSLKNSAKAKYFFCGRITGRLWDTIAGSTH